ncbi:MAG: ATP-binding protein [Spirulina sp. SIO3F2]|nr:ATP-binding protein [Spirulina sp. SIO3F2]
MAPFFFAKRGALLTPDGRQKLEAAVQSYYQDRTIRVNSQRIAQQAGLPLDTTIGILYGQNLTSKRTLKQFFAGFDVTLKRNDFQMVRPEREPRFAAAEEDEPLACVGREAVLAQINQQLQTECWLVVLSGSSGSGKTTLAQHLISQSALRDEFPLMITVELSQLWAGFAAIARQVLGEAIAHKTLEADGMSALAAAVVAKLQSQPILLWLQNLSPELAQTEPFTQFWSALLDSEALRSRLLITTTQANFPPSDRLHTLELPGLSLDAIAQLYADWDITLDTEAQRDCLETIHQTYEGHPLALKLVAGEIRSFPYFGNLLAYWQDYGYELEITPTAESGESLARPIQQPIAPWLQTLGERILQRLAVHAPLAADLLQLGATNARPTPAYGWYFLMGEFSAQQQATTLKALEERLLVEPVSTAQGVRYGVHPVLRCIITTLNRR